MILDILENAHHYSALNKGFAKAFEFLMRPDLKKLPVDKYEIDGKHVYIMVSKNSGRKKEEALLETHDNYIDIQLVLEGTDNMGWKPRQSCELPSGEYNRETDIQFFADKPDAFLSTNSGAFAIFFPNDAHMPRISTGQLHKVVAKVSVDYN